MAGKLSPDLKEVGDLGKAVASLEGMGLTSRQAVKVNLYKRQPGEGLAFILVPNGMEAEAESGNSDRLVVRAHVDSVISTTRNTALGEGKIRVCFVEHILCALALCNVDDLYIEVLVPNCLWATAAATSGSIYLPKAV
ncbi:MAG: UDP-3-O-acyl-N-acetylglucosamine deacetylase [Cyanobacteriota/Melainabacteria group bacterium]